jgi:hypothetical protein
MQKVINFMALTSFAVSGCIVAGGAYVYLNKDSIVENVKTQVIKAATEGVGNAMGAELSGQLMPGVDSPAGDSGGLPIPIPVMPF